MEATDTFIEGHEYKVSVWLKASSNYVFAVNKAYEQDPTSVIEVVYDCGVCNDSVIEEITITNVEVPKAGNTPDYMASTVGTGYKIDESNYENYHVNVLKSSKSLLEWHWYKFANDTLCSLRPANKTLCKHSFTCRAFATSKGGYKCSHL